MTQSMLNEDAPRISSWVNTVGRHRHSPRMGERHSYSDAG